MHNYAVASGEQLFDALVEGANRKYNRSSDDKTVYETVLLDFYEYMLKDLTKSQRKSIRKQTNNNWRNAYFPIQLLMFHKHKAFVPCETHARILLPSSDFQVFDIPLEYFNLFQKQAKQIA